MHYGALILAAIFVFSFVPQAHAYIDPGLGSVLASAIIGLFAAIAYTFRKYFDKAKNAILGRSKGRKGRKNR